MEKPLWQGLLCHLAFVTPYDVSALVTVNPPKKATAGIPGISNPRARFAGAAVGADFDGTDIAAAESAWPEAAS